MPKGGGHLLQAKRPREEETSPLTAFPIGTGPSGWNPTSPRWRWPSSKAENFSFEPYPVEGRRRRQIRRASRRRPGNPLPFLEKMVFKLEKESIPRWNKFLQGYYDLSGITSDSFDQAVTMGQGGKTELTPAMKKRHRPPHIRASGHGLPRLQHARPAIGGYTEDKEKLRRAITIALDHEEYIEDIRERKGHTRDGAGSSRHLRPRGRQRRRKSRSFVFTTGTKRKETYEKNNRNREGFSREAGFEDGRDGSGKAPCHNLRQPLYRSGRAASHKLVRKENSNSSASGSRTERPITTDFRKRCSKATSSSTRGDGTPITRTRKISSFSSPRETARSSIRKKTPLTTPTHASTSFSGKWKTWTTRKKGLL